MKKLDDNQFRSLMDLVMCSDPWPAGVCQETIELLLTSESRSRGFDSWIVAYHEFNPEMMRPKGA